MTSKICIHNNHNVSVSKNDKFTVLCLLIPLISKYLLPSSYEGLLKIEIFDIPIFIPNIFLLIFLIRGIKNTSKSSIKTIFTLQFIFNFISWIFGDYPSNIHHVFIINFINYFLSFYIGIYYTFNSEQVQYMCKILTPTFVLVVIEVILVNTGLVSFGVEQEANTEVYGFVQRATTTMGDTNNGGIALFLLGSIVIYLNKTRKMVIFLITAWVIACMLTVTKSVVLAICFVGTMYGFPILINKNIRFLKKIKYTLLAVIFLTILFEVGVFDPIIERFVKQYVSQELQSGREDLRSDVLNKMDGDVIFLGHGSGNVYPSEDFVYKRKYKTKFRGAPHNSYVLQYAENGIIGLSIFIIFWLCILYKYRKADKFLYLALLCQVGIFYNTETVSMTYMENQLATAIILILLRQSMYEKNTF